MKRVAACLLAVLLLLTACGQTATSPPAVLSTGFSCAADVTYWERSFGIGLVRPGPGICTIDFQSPETMSGMRIEFEGETMNLTYKGLTLSKDTDDSFRVGFASVLASVLDSACRIDPASIKESGGSLLLEGSTEYGTYTITAQPDGTLASIEVPDEKLTLALRDFQPS